MWVKKSNTTYNILQCDIVFVGLIEIFLILSIYFTFSDFRHRIRLFGLESCTIYPAFIFRHIKPRIKEVITNPERAYVHEG